uniref:NTR domain-containing protein n=1 Tax=Magallana gigas TaxID=29159 RepID=A0A8W8LN51_MAGGI|nr:metalloproteinase inhibitor 2-like [Crassostrea gigas]
MRTIAILCVVLAAFYVYSEACRCETKHPQKQFCEADFVIKAEIVTRKRAVYPGKSPGVVYKVKILKTYKGAEYLGRGNFQNVYTPSTACDANLDVGKTFIITGSIQGSKWKTSVCEWNTETSALSQYQKNGLNLGFYNNGCTCEIELCGGSQCGQPTPDKCVAFNKDSDFTCFFRENACKREQQGCDWHRDISICSK